MSVMTKTRVKNAMRKAGISGEVTGSGSRWEVEVPDDKARKMFRTHVCDASGLRTGYGGWILRPEFVDMGDWNDRSSRWHY